MSKRSVSIEMITIPAGEFLYGYFSDGYGDPDSRPSFVPYFSYDYGKQKAYLPEYRLARTPVTNAQYQAFVEATGYRAPHLRWTGRIPRGRKQHPVEGVTWHDAVAFCEWMGCRLPTEQEWEKGARGTEGREYPWGNDWEEGRCNTEEAGIGDTMPVGEYRRGASPYGLLDAAGNVWEWCQDWFEDEHVTKVLKGGSWRNPRNSARCGSRLGDYPDHRLHGEYGFRCCMSSTSSF